MAKSANYGTGRFRTVQHPDGRRARSDRSRVRIIDAGRGLFVERGYVATTMESIAERADVAPQTMYHLFGTKCSILGAVLDTSIVGDHDDDPTRRPGLVRAPGVAVDTN